MNDNDDVRQDIEVNTRHVQDGTNEGFFVRGCSLKDAVLVAQTLCELRGEMIIAIYVR